MYIYIDVLSACVGRRIERWSCRAVNHWSPHSTNVKESQHEYHVPSQSVGAVRGTPQSNDVGQAPAWERERQQCHGFPQTFSLLVDFFWEHPRLACLQWILQRLKILCLCSCMAWCLNGECPLPEVTLEATRPGWFGCVGWCFFFKCFLLARFPYLNWKTYQWSEEVNWIDYDSARYIAINQSSTEWKLRGKWTKGWMRQKVERGETDQRGMKQRD